MSRRLCNGVCAHTLLKHTTVHAVDEFVNITARFRELIEQRNVYLAVLQVLNVDEESYPSRKMGEGGAWSEVWEKASILPRHSHACALY